MQQFQEIVERQNILDRLRSILLLPAPSILMLLQKYCCYNWHTTAILLLLLTYILKWNTTAKIGNLLTQMAYYGHYWHTTATNWILLQKLTYYWHTTGTIGRLMLPLAKHKTHHIAYLRQTWATGVNKVHCPTTPLPYSDLLSTFDSESKTIIDRWR